MPSYRERDIEAYLRKQIEKEGGLFWKFVSPERAGVPDRIAVFPDGRTVFVELKTASGMLTKIQRYQIGLLINLHQQVCVVRGRRGAEHFMRDMREHSVSSVDYDASGDEFDMGGGDA